MALGVVLVDFAVHFFADGFVGAVAVGLVFGKAAHADPDGFILWRDFEGTEVGLEDFAHAKVCARARRQGEHGCQDFSAGGTESRQSGQML